MTRWFGTGGVALLLCSTAAAQDQAAVRSWHDDQARFGRSLTAAASSGDFAWIRNNRGSAFQLLGRASRLGLPSSAAVPCAGATQALANLAADLDRGAASSASAELRTWRESQRSCDAALRREKLL